MNQSDELNPQFTRRDFHKATLAAGAALATGGLISGCGGGSGTPSSTLTHSAANLHFDLSHLPADSLHTLRVAGNRIALVPHTEDSLAAAGAAEPYLAGKQNVTHYASDVQMPDHKPLHFSVTTEHPVRGHGLVYACIHIPERDRTAARSSANSSAKGLRSKTACSVDSNDRKRPFSSVECKISDQLSDNFHTAFDSAKALVFHHPEIASTDTSVAAAVEALMEASAVVANLASEICTLGPAYEHDPAFADGWCVLVPLTNSDGTPKLDTNGTQVYDYQFNPHLNGFISAAVKEILSLIKNDPSLDGKMYTSHPVGSTDDNSASATGLSAKMRKRINLFNSGGTQVTMTTQGFKHQVWFQDPIYTGSNGVVAFSLPMNNWNFLCYGLYVEFRDNNGNALTQPDSDMANILGTWLESDTCKLQGFVISPPTLFGVPIGVLVQEVEITLPAGAVSARVMLCGPGSHGKVDYGPSLLPGCLLTAIINYALPMYSLYSGTGLTDTSGLYEILKQPGTLVKIAALLLNDLKWNQNSSHANDMAVGGSIETLMLGVVQGCIQILTNGAVPKLSAWVVEQTTETEADEAIPFLGWAIRILTVTLTVADIYASDAEICINPLVIDNIATFTNSVDVTVNCDPDNSQFPREATYYEVQFMIAGARYPAINPQGFTLDQATRGLAAFTAPSINGVPTSGKRTTNSDGTANLNADYVEVWFYSDSSKGYLSAHGQATFDNISSPSNLTAAITIAQNPIPLSAATTYAQKSKLAYSGGKYIWQEGAELADPVVQASNCSGGLCGLGNISVWVPGGMIGYTWQIGNAWQLKNVNASETDPNPGMKLRDSGTGSPTPVVYDKTCPKTNLSGNHFYLDPVSISADNPEYHLRKLSLDKASTTFATTGSWGRFRIPLDRIAVHPQGYVVGISFNNSKMAVLELPTDPYQAYADDNHANNAVLKLGEGVGDRLIQSPQALAISKTGAILILQGQGQNMSIKAFDVHGNPWAYFSNGTAFSFPLANVDAGAQWLDIDIDDTDYIFILSYTGTGQNQSDYHLDVYDKNGTKIVRNTGIAVSRMAVDKFRTPYTLNQEAIAGSPIVEPSVSVWLPSLPTA